MNLLSSQALARGFVTRAVVLVLGCVSLARADLVTARLAYAGGVGASLQATLGAEGIYLSGATGDGTGSFCSRWTRR